MITSESEAPHSAVLERLGERARIVLRVGFPRLIHHSKELARAVNAFKPNHPQEFNENIARISGAEALSVIARLPESMRVHLLKGRQISSADRRRLARVFEKLGRSTDRTSVAAALERLAPDSAADVPADLPDIVHDRAFSNVPTAPGGGFFGRARELDQIEEWLQGKIRRITISGLGGQGKTALAQEAGRWLLRSGMFRAAIFLDCTRWRGLDAGRTAINEISGVLGESLIDDQSVEASLWGTPTLLILDGLDALTDEELRPLLDASAAWSEVGETRLLCTTRRSDLGHAGYRSRDLHRRIMLHGLGSRTAPDDALEWFAALSKLPPKPTQPTPTRGALIELFDKVKFHPLSIRVLAQQLKTQRLTIIDERLGQLLIDPKLGTGVQTINDTPAALFASFQLSLEKLDDKVRAVLPRLGVFQGGAFEDDLLAITELGEFDERTQLTAHLAAVEQGDLRAILRATGRSVEGELPTEVAAQLRQALPAITTELRQKLAALPPISENIWPELRRHLDAAGLLTAESVPGVEVPFLRFHPILAPLLWEQLSSGERTDLAIAHRRRYAALARYLYYQDNKTPHEVRAIARRDLPNLLHAVHAALDAAEPEAGEFTEYVNKFLNDFGLRHEAEELLAKANIAASELGSRAWFLVQSSRAEQLRTSGRIDEAVKAFQVILGQIGENPTYERALTLGRLGRCFRAEGRPDLAIRTHHEEIAVLDKLDQVEPGKRGRERSIAFTDLADALADAGQYAEARSAYERGLAIAEELGDPRSQAVSLGQLGTLAMVEGNVDEAIERHQAALAIFKRLHEPVNEAVAWHQLGNAFHQARRWEDAERHYRESAKIKEQHGNLASAAQTWSNLAAVNESLGKPEVAEEWYRKAIEAFRASGNRNSLAIALNNLAVLLWAQPTRLAEARTLVEEALAIKETLDPGAAEIWMTYALLAEVAQSQSKRAESGRQIALRREANEYRRLAREARRAFPGTRTQLRHFAPIVLATVLACGGNDKARRALAQQQAAMRETGSDLGGLADAIDRVLTGERSAESLCTSLGPDQSMLIEYILEAIENPEALEKWVSTMEWEG